MKSTICLLAFFIFSFTLPAQQLNIIPQPAEMTIGKGNFALSGTTAIVIKNGVDDNTADFFNDYLNQYFGFKLKKVKSAVSNYIQFATLQTLVAGKEGAYSLAVNSKNIIVNGQTASGTFYGMQTLIQLLPVSNQKPKIKNFQLPIPQLSITDYPRFSYRGMHLDVGRHFFPVSFVKKYIDYLALHKFNVFHWHLTEDQGWRIEIKKYPRLTSVGAWRNGTIIGRYPGKGNDGLRHGGYYTQEEIKEVVKYAAVRFIDVIPEIEMPGHSSAAIAAYPELSCFPNESTRHPKQCAWSGDSTGKQVQQTWGVFNDVFCAGKENTFKFLQGVIDEVITLFPSRYIHIGGDECPKENWKRCPACQQRMKDNDLKTEHELQSFFIQRMEKYINSKGKTLIGWDEILEGGLAPNAIVMSWRGEKGGIEAAQQKHTVIMTPGEWVYLNYSQTRNEDSVTIGGYLPLEKVYKYEPVPGSLTDEQSKYVLGAQGNLWTEYIGNKGIAEYMLFPRMSALSEVLWSAKEKRNWNDFEKRLQTQFKRYDLWKAHYSKAYFDIHSSILPATNNSGVLWKLDAKFYDNDTRIVYGFSKINNELKDYKNPILITNNTFVAATLNDDGRILDNFIKENFRINKATGKKITLAAPPSDKYPGDGAFTLVNGVQNEKGLERSGECLGFEAGADCEAVIDLGSSLTINNAVIHTLSSGGSWVYPPRYAEAFISGDGQNFSSAGKSEKFETTNGTNGIIKIDFAAVSARYIKVFVKNFGIVPQGMSGAGNGAWLFVDEIEIN